MKNLKIVGLLVLIAQKKGFDALNATQKTPALCKVSFLKKMVITGYYDCLLLLIQRVTTLTTHMGTTNVYFDWLQLATKI